jgi:hypothetical protein
MTITLQDVEVMLGLLVDGEVLVGSTELNWSELCLQLLGVSPPPNKLDGSRLNMKWLQDTFGVLPDDANEVTMQRYTRAYILEFLGGSYFADSLERRYTLCSCHSWRTLMLLDGIVRVVQL